MAVFYGEKNGVEIGRSFLSGLLLTALVLVLLVALGLGTLPFLGELIRLDDAAVQSVREAFVVALAGTGLVVFSHTLFAVTQGLQSGPGNGLIYNGALLVSLVVTVVGLARGWGLLALAWPVVLRGVLYTLGNGLYLRWRLRAEGIRLHFSPKNLRDLLQPLPVTLLARLAGALLANLENALLARRLGVAAVPVYALTRKGPDLARLAIERGVLAFGPALALTVGQGDGAVMRRVVARLGLVLVWALGLLAGAVVLFNEPFVRLWVGSAFFSGKTANALLAAVVVLQALTNALIALGVALGQVRRTSALQIGQGALHALAVGVGCWSFGLVGLLAGGVLSFSVATVFFLRVVWPETGLTGAECRLFWRESVRQTFLLAGLIAGFRLSMPVVDGWVGVVGFAALFAGAHSTLTVLFSPASRTLFSFPKKSDKIPAHP